MSATVCIFDGLVCDLMNPEAPAVMPRTPLQQVAEIMAERDCRHVVVINDERHVLGVLSQRDVLKQLIQRANQGHADEEGAEDSPPLSASQLIGTKPITVMARVPLLKAGLVLATNKIGCLPVVDEENCLQGTLTVSDLLRHATGDHMQSLEGQFKLFTPTVQTRPKAPAFFRRSTQDLVLPKETVGELDPSLNFALLGYDEKSDRILVKLLNEKDEGSQRIFRDQENYVISGSEFIGHFDIKFHGRAYRITRQNIYLILLPK